MYDIYLTLGLFNGNDVCIANRCSTLTLYCCASCLCSCHVCEICHNVWCAGGVMESAVDNYDSSHGSSYDRSTVKVYIPSRTSTQTTQELLYVTLGVVLGSSLLTLIVIMFVCSCRHRQRQRILGSFRVSSSLVAFSRHILWFSYLVNEDTILIHWFTTLKLSCTECCCGPDGCIEPYMPFRLVKHSGFIWK